MRTPLRSGRKRRRVTGEFGRRRPDAHPESRPPEPAEELTIAGGHNRASLCARLRSGAVVCRREAETSFTEVPEMRGASSLTIRNEVCGIVGGEVACMQQGRRLTIRVEAPRAIASGGGPFCVLREGGLISCRGLNYDGSVGDGTTTARSQPVEVIGVRGATSVTAGSSHACALVGGGVLCWGGSTYTGREGVERVYSESGGTPIVAHSSAAPVAGLSSVDALSSGRYQTCAVRSGRVWCWGAGRVLGGDGAHPDTLTPVEVPGLEDVVEVASADRFACARHRDGGATCWGGLAVPGLGADIAGP